jgi:hypothetical protein
MGYAQLMLEREREKKRRHFFGPKTGLCHVAARAYNGVDENDKEYEESDVKQRNHRHQDGVEHNLQTCKNETSESGRWSEFFLRFILARKTEYSNGKLQ